VEEIGFRIEDMREVKKAFRGVIVGAEYGEEPFGMKGRPDIPRRKQLCIKIYTPDYIKPQYEWYVPSNKKKTKWAYLIEGLQNTGALMDMVIVGDTAEEKVRSFADQLIGMEFDWEEREVEIIARKTTDCLIPVVYYGRKSKEEVEKLRESLGKGLIEEEIKEEEVKL